MTKIGHFYEKRKRLREYLGVRGEKSNIHNTMCKKEFSFEKGWSQVKNGDAATVREKLMTALNLTTRAAFLNRKRGDVEPKFSEIKAIESIFADYGIKEVWGAC